MRHVARIDNMAFSILFDRTHIQHGGAVVDEAHGVCRADGGTRLGAVAEFENDGHQSQHGGGGHQQGMMRDVLKKALHEIMTDRSESQMDGKYNSPSASHRRPRGSWLVHLALALACGPIGAGGVQAAKSAPASKQAELDSMRARMEAIRQAIAADLQQREATTVELKTAEVEVQSARQELGSLRAQRRASEEKLRELSSARQLTEQRIAAERGALAAELRVAYINGQAEQLKLLLNQEDPATLGRSLVFFRYFAKARTQRIGEINEQLAHLELIATEIAAETERLRSLEQSHDRQVQNLAQARDHRAATLQALNSSLKDRGAELAKVQRDAQALEKLIEQLRRAAEDFPTLAQQPFDLVKGKLPWPAKGRLLGRFGQPRSGGPLKWQGILIATDRGSQVRPPFYGRVLYADWLPGMGLLLVLDHGGGYMSLYGHNEQLYRKVGERVSPGDVMATVGDSGGNAQAGLYMEIRKGKTPVDPLTWLKKP
jgi:septal ring factor EnvC (AmiA/AmiB activator)